MKERGIQRIPESRVISLLEDIENGKIKVMLNRNEPRDKENVSGVFHYNTSNGWAIGVYVDCSQFDYFDYIQHGGKKLDYSLINRYYKKVENFEQRFRRKDVARRIFGIEEPESRISPQKFDNIMRSSDAKGREYERVYQAEARRKEALKRK